MEIPTSFTDLSGDDLTALRASIAAEFNTRRTSLSASSSDEDIQHVEALRDGIVAADAELAARAERAARAASLAEFSTEQPAPQAVETPAPVEGDGRVTEGEQAAPVEGEQAPAAPAEQAPEAPAEGNTPPEGGSTPAATPAANQASQGGTHTMSTNPVVPRPVVPDTSARRVTLTAAADVPDFSAGATIPDRVGLAAAVLAKVGSFPAPYRTAYAPGESSSEDLRKFAVASYHKNFEPELVLTAASGPAEVERVFQRAADESRLPGGSLTAAAGWCAPSEQQFDLNGTGATTDGILTLPEVQMPRAGIKFTDGPDWGDIYGASNVMFTGTEAQAIAGTINKACATIPCPSFREVRLDVIGRCIKIEFLMEAAYPENVALWLRELETAWQHMVNVKNINKIISLLPAKVDLTGAAKGSTAQDLANRVAFIVEREREIRRLPQNFTYEVLLPRWVMSAMKADLAWRSNREGASAGVSDAEVNSLFPPNVKLNWTLGYQDLGAAVIDYPATFDFAVYPAGMFIRGSLDVVNLSAVYDAASLAQNVYTGVFFEEGWQVFKRGYGGGQYTLPVCNSGRLGALNVTCA